MRVVGVRDLRNRLSEYLRAVRAGEAILVTHRGEVVAELHQPGQVSPSGYLAVGMAALAKEGSLLVGKSNQEARYRRLSRLAPGVSTRELLDEERGER